MTDDLLTTFRSEMPLPDDETARRIYERATSGRRNVFTRRRLAAVVAVIAAAGISGGLSATLGGGASKPPAGTDQSGGPTQSFGTYAQNLYTFNRDGQMLTSVAVTVRDQNYTDATMTIEVLHRDASQPADIGVAKMETVFAETAPMTATGAIGDGAVLSTWSGTLSPSDWNGGCQPGYYVIWTAVDPAGTTVAGNTVADPSDFWSAHAHTEESNAWFSCNGS